MARFRQGDAETARHIGQKPHDREFTGSDSKTAASQRQNDERELEGVKLR
ncbi:hypothetical protein GCM10011491_09430 [Brucella endophytica]|uniref:Uncharacterized protein n=1 Tax=Brucella endophytica TaxID=1963359 RepID=A0A916WBV3_9HYPH|nr:hypothetical protein GCM10011491_09430 [Brucella endophytica]